MSAESSKSAHAPVLSDLTSVSLLAVFAALAVPLFVCAPLTSDTSLFDVQALTVMEGGVLYRDVLEPNLPGIVWLHMLIRTAAGWSSEAIRIVDLLIFSATIFVLLCVLRTTTSGGRQKQYRPIFALITTLFYLTRNEWCHCQRDMWTMLPVSIALLLRFRRKSPGSISSVMEGLFWGAAFWIKPHIAIPAAAAMLVDVFRFDGWKNRLMDITLVIVGGIIAALPGIHWLIASGAWEHFWEMMLEWNPEYLATGRTRRSWDRLSFMFQRFYPWWLVHCIAIPVAMTQLRDFASNARRQALRAVSQPDDESAVEPPEVLFIRAALSACYLAWLAQTFLIQHAMDYIHVPEVILGILVVTIHRWSLPQPIRRLAVCGMLGLVMIGLPQLQQGRWTVWFKCLSEGSTPEIRSALAQGNYPDWVAMNAVKQFLADQSVGNGDVTCLNVHSIHLHSELKVLPSSRYSSITHPLTMYPSRYDQIMTSVNNSRHRFVVLDEVETAHPGQVLPDEFPRQYPVVFEYGRYRVYAPQARRQVASPESRYQIPTL